MAHDRPSIGRETLDSLSKVFLSKTSAVWHNCQIACLSSFDASRLSTGRCSYAWKFLVQAVMGPRRNLLEVAARPGRRLNMVTPTLWESRVSGYCSFRALPFSLKSGRLTFPILPSSSPPAFLLFLLALPRETQLSGWLV